MSFLVTVVAILAFLVLLGLLMRMLKGVFAIIVPVALMILVLALGAWIFTDINDLRNHFYQDEKLFVLDIDGRAVAAFRMGGAGIPDPVADLRGIRAGYPDLALVQGDAYKVIVMDWSVVAEDVELAGFRATAGEIRAALLSDNPKKLFVDKAVDEYGAQALGQIKLQADELYPAQDSFSGAVFALLANRPLGSPDVFLSGLKQGTIVVFPETVTFKILRFLPEGTARALIAPQQAE